MVLKNLEPQLFFPDQDDYLTVPTLPIPNWLIWPSVKTNYDKGRGVVAPILSPTLFTSPYALKHEVWRTRTLLTNRDACFVLTLVVMQKSQHVFPSSFRDFRQIEVPNDGNCDAGLVPNGRVALCL